MTGIERISAAFAAAGRRAALMPYLMGGFPDADTSLAIGLACADHGADLVELGVPFSDPLADGPVIHAAATSALAAGATLDAVLRVAEGLAPRLPVVLMCYSNPILARGIDHALARLEGAGVSGLIVPDLPHEESEALRVACGARGMALVPLVAPTTPAERLARIGADARGFLYVVSVTGTTGERAGGDGDLRELLECAAAHSAAPVAVGFGISTPAQAAAAARAGARGVIVGSRLVRAAGESDDPPSAVGELVAELRAALDSAAPVVSDGR